MKPALDLSPKLLFRLTAASIFGAGFLRALLAYRDTDDLILLLSVLGIWLVALVSEPALSRRWTSRRLGGHFTIYVFIQAALLYLLVSELEKADFLAILFAILSMQVMQRFTPRVGWLWIGLFALLIAQALLRDYSASDAIALALLYTALNVFVAFYSLATRHAQEARLENQKMVAELEATNQQLQAYSQQLEQLAAARERLLLARELHDSVTQTIFSMNLTTQSALVLQERDPSRVAGQLDHLSQLAKSALSEMHVLISELRPNQVAEGGLAAALRQHLVNRPLAENLTISITVEGSQPLMPAEEQGLFRIAQEAVNNVVKHSGASQVVIRLHQAEPFWIEIEDQGQGFDLQAIQTGAQAGSRVGLTSMRERAEEMGWNLRVITSPGAGTRIRVEKPTGEKQA
jgi:signal transduction histidine kinase